MANFRYRAMTVTGVPINGNIEAPSETAVIQQIRSAGHIPISATDLANGSWLNFLGRSLLPIRKPKPRDLALATQELATLLNAGLQLDHALGILATLQETRALHQPIASVLDKVRDGASFADALAGEHSFPKLYVSMVRAGEMGGNLEATLARVADYLARSQVVRDAVASALVYPIILLCTAGISIAVILVVVLPQFEPLFAEAGRNLPLATRIVMAIGHFVGAFWWMFLFGTAAGILWYRKALQRPEFRRRRDALLFKLPLFGDLLQKMEMERFSRTLGTLLHNGVALPTALGITKDTLTNVIIAEAVGATAVSLREGETLAGRLARTKAFPAMTLDLVRVGEESGKLDQMLLRQADLYEQQVKHKVEWLLSLLVPVLTVVLGMIIAGLIASMLVAILSVNDLAI